MRKKLFYILIIGFFTILLIECKKNSIAQRIVMFSPLIRTVITGNNITFYSYDDFSRLAKKGDNPYVYRNDSVLIYQILSPTDSTSYYTYYELNDSGLAAGQRDYNQEIKRSFDKDSFVLVKKTDVSQYGTYTDSLFNDGTNYISVISNNYSIYNGSHADFLFYRLISTFTFRNELNTIGNINFGESFLGKSNKNLIATENIISESTVCSPPSPCHLTIMDTVNYNYSYEFDSKNRVIKLTKTNVASSVSSITNYTYY